MEAGIECIALDTGPGISRRQAAMRDGYSTAASPGIRARRDPAPFARIGHLFEDRTGDGDHGAPDERRPGACEIAALDAGFGGGQCGQSGRGRVRRRLARAPQRSDSRCWSATASAMGRLRRRGLRRCAPTSVRREATRRADAASPSCPPRDARGGCVRRGTDDRSR